MRYSRVRRLVPLFYVSIVLAHAAPSAAQTWAESLIQSYPPKSARGPAVVSSSLDITADPDIKDGICEPERARPDLDCYTVFESLEQAVTFFEQQLEPRFSRASRAAERAVVPDGDPLYGQRIEQLRKSMSDGWKAFATTTDVGALPEPQLVIIDDAEPNAFAPGGLDNVTVPLMIVMQTGLLVDGAPPEGPLGVIFHELEHAVGRHALPGRDAALRVFYSAAQCEVEPLGFESENNSSIAEPVSRWIALGEQVGSYTDPEFLGMPDRDAGNVAPVFAILFEEILLDAQSYHPVECEAAFQAEADWGRVVAEYRSVSFDRLLLVGDAARAAVREASRRYADAAAGCLADYAVSFVDLKDVLSEVGLALDETDQTLYQAEHNPADGLRALIGRRKAAMQQLLTPELSQYARTYTVEERADDRSVQVLLALGLEPSRSADFMFDMLIGDAPDAAACESLLRSGEVPPYGALIDDHHSTCYRLFHIRALTERLSQSR